MDGGGISIDLLAGELVVDKLVLTLDGKFQELPVKVVVKAGQVHKIPLMN